MFELQHCQPQSGNDNLLLTQSWYLENDDFGIKAILTCIPALHIISMHITLNTFDAHTSTVHTFDWFINLHTFEWCIYLQISLHNFNAHTCTSPCTRKRSASRWGPSRGRRWWSRGRRRHSTPTASETRPRVKKGHIGSGRTDGYNVRQTSYAYFISKNGKITTFYLANFDLE